MDVDVVKRLEEDNARLRAFIFEFSEAKFEEVGSRHISRDPQDDLDPVTDLGYVEVWQDDARAALKPEAAQ